MSREIGRLVGRAESGGDLDAAPVQLVEQLAEPLGEDRDLDLLEDDAHDAAAVAGLQEERPVARLTDGAGDEAFGRVEDVAPSRHDLTLYRFGAGTGAV